MSEPEEGLGAAEESLSAVVVGSQPSTDKSPIKSEKLARTEENEKPGFMVYFLMAGLCLCMFLVNIEVTIVSTSLVAITNDLGGYDQVGWLVSGYLATYSSFIVVWSKLSDLTGRKITILATVACFTSFSIGCGAAQSITTLILCRVFQGIGAAGCYSLIMIVFFEAVPVTWYGAGGGVISSFIALAALSGPLLGGLISETIGWRWIFYINGPLGGAVLLMFFVTIPRNFPHHQQKQSSANEEKKSSMAAWRHFDIVGSVLLLSASILLVTAILQAGDQRVAWSAPITIAFLVLSALSWVGFALWERYITNSTKFAAQPIFPWRFVLNRAWAGMLLTCFLCGMPFNVLIVNIPQRMQSVNGLSAVQAGVRLLPFSVVAPAASIATSVLAGKRRVPFICFLLIGGSLQLIGAGLLISLPPSSHFHAAQYGYEAIAGAGMGVSFGILFLGVPFAVDKRDLATATGAMVQVRMLGGAIGVGVASTLFNSHVWSNLAKFLSPDQITTIREASSSISKMPPEIRSKVQATFSEAFRVEFIFTTVVIGLSLLTALMVWRKPQLLAAK